MPFSVIGRGGEQINKLQSETGAKIQVAPGKPKNSVCEGCFVNPMFLHAPLYQRI